MTPATEDWATMGADGDASPAVRRANYAENPLVGARGQRARQHILDTALKVFGEVGYHETGIKRIVEASGYSRAGFYQYFSSKEDLFRHLSGTVARLLAKVMDDLGHITPDAAGRAEIRTWLDRYGELYRAFAPVFVTFQTAAASDEAVADGSARVAVRTYSTLRSKIDGSPLPSRHIDGIARTLPNVAVRTYATFTLLRSVGVEGWLADDARVLDAVADVFHRALFRPDREVNAPPRSGPETPPPIVSGLRFDPAAELAGGPSLNASARRTRSQILEAGHRVFAEQGYHAANAVDIVRTAGVSQGIFYRYFQNKKDLFRLLAERASVRIADAFSGVPVLAGPHAGADVASALRGWLTEYAGAVADEATIMGMWSEAMSRDPQLGPISVAVTEDQRAACAALLAERDFGDADADALVMVMVLDSMTSRRSPTGRVETTAQIIERGLFAPPAGS